MPHDVLFILDVLSGLVCFMSTFLSIPTNVRFSSTTMADALDSIAKIKESNVMAPLLPVEIVHDIVCYALSSFYWAYFVNGDIVYKGSILSENPSEDDDGSIKGQKGTEWDPAIAMAGINAIFREQTLRIASKALGIPRAVGGRFVSL